MRTALVALIAATLLTAATVAAKTDESARVLLKYYDAELGIASNFVLINATGVSSVVGKAVRSGPARPTTHAVAGHSAYVADASMDQLLVMHTSAKIGEDPVLEVQSTLVRSSSVETVTLYSALMLNKHSFVSLARSWVEETYVVARSSISYQQTLVSQLPLSQPAAKIKSVYALAHDNSTYFSYNGTHFTGNNVVTGNVTYVAPSAIDMISLNTVLDAEGNGMGFAISDGAIHVATINPMTGRGRYGARVDIAFAAGDELMASFPSDACGTPTSKYIFAAIVPAATQQVTIYVIVPSTGTIVTTVSPSDLTTILGVPLTTTLAPLAIILPKPATPCRSPARR